jgi:hypothetical protein
MRRSILTVAAVLFPIAATGCANDGSWSISRMLGWEDDKPYRPDRMPKADLAIAERVETVGRKIITQNTFTGIEPLFHTIGVPESVLFHRGSEELIISEGTVKQCRNDSELAAVLCLELSQMIAEKKSARRVGSDRDSFPDISVPTGSGLAGGTPADPGRAAEVALLEKQRQKNLHSEAVDASRLARDLMRGAGYDPAELDTVSGIVKQSARGLAIQKQLNGTAPAPTWNR